MPGREQLLDVLPALLVARAGDVRVRELVDESDLRLAREDGVEVQLLERAVAVRHASPRDDLEVADLRRRLRPAVRLHEADDDVLAVVAAAPALVEHRERLSDAGRCSEVEPERSSRHGYSVTATRGSRVEREVELEHVHAGLAEEAERAARRCARRRARARPSSGSSRAARPAAPGARRSRGEMCGSRPEPEAVTASTGHLVPAATAVQRAVGRDALLDRFEQRRRSSGPRFDAELAAPS